MKPSAVLLIDLENFFLSRVQYFNKNALPQTGRPSFAQDFERLITFSQRMAGAQFAVRRAYADYATLRVGPRDLMRQGVEPVQVFRLSGNKNAADMRMAMDAASLLNGTGQVDHFILVTGDGDFIPVILELKRHGHTVSVIGVTGATNELIQRFVDNFELFEDLLAAEEVEARSGENVRAGDSIVHVAECVRRLLALKGPLRFAAVKPLLSKELGHPFDPGDFGCDTTGEFLQKYQSELGVAIRQTQHDKELDLIGSAPPSANGVNGSKVAAKPSPRPAPAPKPGVAEPHTTEHYKQMLTGRGLASSAVGTVRVPAVPWGVLAWSCDTVAALLTPPEGAPTHTTNLLPKLVKAADGCALPDVVKHLRAFYPILRAGLGAQPPDGVYALREGTTGEAVRRGVFQYVGYVLKCRLTDAAVGGDVRPEVLATVFDPGPALEQATSEIAAALVEPPTPDAAPPALTVPARTGPTAEELHTATGYLKLLKAGGAKGSDTEAFKILPVPWPSVERVCADLVPIFGTSTTPMTRDDLTRKLIEAGKDMYLDRYDQHVRRALGIVRIAGDLSEESGGMVLNPEITSGQELRNRALAFLLQLLQLRLEERDVLDPIRPLEFATAIEAGPLTDALVKEVEPAIAWLYRRADETPTPVPDDAPELPSTPPDDADSGVVRVGADSDPGSVGEVAPAAAEPEPEPVLEWDGNAYEFDGVLPEAPAPTARIGTANPCADPPSGILGELNVAELTSEAVAAAGAGQDAGADEDELILAVPVTDWMPVGDPLTADDSAKPDPPAAEELVRGRPTPVPPPLPGATPPPIPKMTPPPLPSSVQPPPLPPPESA